jgi:hypothetical protein
MTHDESTEALRKAIKVAGVAEVARLAGVKPTTLYSFCSGATTHLRSDTKAKVEAVLQGKPGVELNDGNLAQIISIWDHIPAARRRMLADTARAFAEKPPAKK